MVNGIDDEGKCIFVEIYMIVVVLTEASENVFRWHVVTPSCLPGRVTTTLAQSILPAGRGTLPPAQITKPPEKVTRLPGLVN